MWSFVRNPVARHQRSPHGEPDGSEVQRRLPHEGACIGGLLRSALPRVFAFNKTYHLHQGLGVGEHRVCPLGVRFGVKADSELMRRVERGVRWSLCQKPRETFSYSAGSRFCHGLCLRLWHTREHLPLSARHCKATTAPPLIFQSTANRNAVAVHVRFWPKADMGQCSAHVRFRG